MKNQKKILLAAYLLNPGQRNYDVLKLDFKKLQKELKSTGLIELFEKVEVPLVSVLADMEKIGIKIDVKHLEKMSGEFEKDLKKLTKQIHKLAGEEFNIKSPLQLKKILFEKLAISARGVRKTFKTGALSTSARELVKLQGIHPIIKLIIKYRELQKLKSTYIDALPKLVDSKTGRVHTNFNQTVTATGRLSSSSPNLQNIPIRSEYGKEIRKAFVADRGKVFLAFDYSQIELRIVAHMADDKKMIEAFNAGADIHTRTAAEVWKVEPEKVTKNMRRAAKAINFGITYGMGARALAEAGGMSVQEAHEFIGRYFSLHQGIKNYIDETKALARSMGYVETMFGRRRYLLGITSMIPPERASAERMATNHPIQGTAADIIKMAMIKIHKDVKHPMLLQVHDELVFEVTKKDIKNATKQIKEIMENVVKLKVPILVDVSEGKNWGEV
ncbi:MAG: DNA polymerase [Patescibacteria group bacterium]|nr:DNA polymerase [Patescibacteria group bacterium]